MAQKTDSQLEADVLTTYTDSGPRIAPADVRTFQTNVIQSKANKSEIPTDTGDITEGSRLYFTNARVLAIAADRLGYTNRNSLSGNATTADADWNKKVNVITNISATHTITLPDNSMGADGDEFYIINEDANNQVVIAGGLFLANYTMNRYDSVRCYKVSAGWRFDRHIGSTTSGAQGPQGAYYVRVYEDVPQGNTAPAAPSATSYNTSTNSFNGLTNTWSETPPASITITTRDYYYSDVLVNPANAVNDLVTSLTFSQAVKYDADTGAPGSGGGGSALDSDGLEDLLEAGDNITIGQNTAGDKVKIDATGGGATISTLFSGAIDIATVNVSQAFPQYNSADVNIDVNTLNDEDRLIFTGRGSSQTNPKEETIVISGRVWKAASANAAGGSNANDAIVTFSFINDSFGNLDVIIGRQASGVPWIQANHATQGDLAFLEIGLIKSGGGSSGGSGTPYATPSISNFNITNYDPADQAQQQISVEYQVHNPNNVSGNTITLESSTDGTTYTDVATDLLKNVRSSFVNVTTDLSAGASIYFRLTFTDTNSVTHQTTPIQFTRAQSHEMAYIFSQTGTDFTSSTNALAGEARDVQTSGTIFNTSSPTNPGGYPVSNGDVFAIATPANRSITSIRDSLIGEVLNTYTLVTGSSNVFQINSIQYEIRYTTNNSGYDGDYDATVTVE